MIMMSMVMAMLIMLTSRTVMNMIQTIISTTKMMMTMTIVMAMMMMLTSRTVMNMILARKMMMGMKIVMAMMMMVMTIVMVMMMMLTSQADTMAITEIALKLNLHFALGREVEVT